MTRAFTWACAAVVAGWATIARADTYPRQPGVDAWHYVFTLELSDTSAEIAGEATVDVRFTRDGVTTVALDLGSLANGKGMTVTSVTSDGKAVRFVHQHNVLTLPLQTPSTTGRHVRFTIAYHGAPAGGLRILPNKHGDWSAFSENWPNHARDWLPIIDHPYDKATSEFIVTAPARFQVVANGLLLEETDLGDGRRRTHWKQSVPIASWLNALGVEQFAVFHVGRSQGVELQTWVAHQDADAGRVYFEKPAREAMEFYSEHVGPYPYEKLANVAAAGLNGGTEHASAIFYGESGVRPEPATGLVAHEIAHQWFGDSVTEGDWDDVWLSEGFATYFTLLFTEHTAGREAFVAGLKSSRTRAIATEKVAAGHQRDSRQPLGHEQGAQPARLPEGRLGAAHAPRGHRHRDVLGRHPRLLSAVSRRQRVQRGFRARDGGRVGQGPVVVLLAVAAATDVAVACRQLAVRRGGARSKWTFHRRSPAPRIEFRWTSASRPRRASRRCESSAAS